MRSTRTLLFSQICIAILACLQTVAAQDQPVPTNTAPPPAKVISAEERSIIERVGDHKGRVKKTIEIAEGHLAQAEAFTTAEKHHEASAELGKYWALIEDVLHHLSPLDNDKTKTRDLYKRLELSLRAHGTRLAMMRRTTPVEYAVWVKTIEEFTRTSRTEALNSFYGQTVVREESPPKHSTDKTPKTALTAPESKQP
jgi:hypothetical protein